MNYPLTIALKMEKGNFFPLLKPELIIKFSQILPLTFPEVKNVDTLTFKEFFGLTFKNFFSISRVSEKQ